MGTVIPLFGPRTKEAEHNEAPVSKPTTIHLQYFEGGTDGRSEALVLLSNEALEEPLVVPFEVIHELYRLIPYINNDISPELRLLIQRMSQSEGPTDSQLKTLSHLLVHGNESIPTGSNVTSLAEQRLSRSGNEPQDTIETLESFSRSAYCHPLLSEFIDRILVEMNSKDKAIEEERAKIHTKLTAVLEYGIRNYTSPENLCVIGEVVLAFNGAFETVTGVARGKIYHDHDLTTLFQLKNIQFHRNARLKLVVPLLPPGEAPEMAKAMLLKKLLTGNHLNAEKTESVLEQKIANAEVISQVLNLRQITLTASDLVACGLPETVLFS